MTEKELVNSAIKGDVYSFGALYEMYVDAIYRFCLFSTNRNAQESQDLTQDIFIKVAKSIKKFKGKSSFKNWLYAIAKNTIKDWIRKKNIFKLEPLYETIIDDPDLIDPEKQHEVEIKIQKLLNLLEANERKVIELRFLKGYSLIEASNEIGISVSNVKVTSHRAIKKLKNVDYGRL